MSSKLFMLSMANTMRKPSPVHILLLTGCVQDIEETGFSIDHNLGEIEMGGVRVYARWGWGMTDLIPCLLHVHEERLGKL